jgi:hypothetical protein
MVTGVKDGFERKLEIVGIGYRCQLQGKALQLALGYSHPIVFPLPDGIQAEVDRQVAITLRGADKALSGRPRPSCGLSASRIPTRARASSTPTNTSAGRSARRQGPSKC